MGGVVGSFLSAAFGKIECGACGPLDLSEFDPPILRKILMGSIALAAMALAVLGGVVALTLHQGTNRP